MFSFNKVVTFLLFALLSCNIFAAPMDFEISANIEAQYGANGYVRDENIEVTTKQQGYVTLVGVARNNFKATVLIALAYATTGVRYVDTSRLTLEYGKPLSRDVVMAGEVWGKILRQGHFCDNEYPPIRVTARNGMVCLYGKMRSERQIQQAIYDAESVRGVREVHSQIRVKQ